MNLDSYVNNTLKPINNPVMRQLLFALVLIPLTSCYTIKNEMRAWKEEIRDDMRDGVTVSKPFLPDRQLTIDHTQPPAVDETGLWEYNRRYNFMWIGWYYNPYYSPYMVFMNNVNRYPEPNRIYIYQGYY
jgi:hypothetical protein